MELTHLSLFTGIGGIDLAAEWAGFETVGQCEFAEYPTKVLEKHWPDVPRWKDVRELTAKSIREKGIGKVTLLSGGFPCQPHSLAGERKASGDERDLWPEFRRIIGEVNPRWVLGENVRGLLTSEDGRFFRGILRDFADMGFNVGWCTYPAAWVGAIHRRERIFIVAHSNGDPGTLSIFDWNSEEGFKRYKKQKVRCNDRVKFKMAPGFDTRVFSRCRQLELPRLVRVGTRSTREVDIIRKRLTAIGNMVMPQQVYPIVKAIADIERSLS